MRGRVAITSVAAVAVACLIGAPCFAVPGRSTNTDTDAESGSIIPRARQEGWRGSAASGPSCTWEAVDGKGLPGTSGGSPTGAWEREGPGGQETLQYRSKCTDGRPDGYFWIPTVDVADLRQDAYDEVAKQLPLPSPDISPDPATGGYVNFGLWLAVDDPGSLSATAAAGPVWVTITARYGDTTWNMGTGGDFGCEGLGTPVADPDTAEQGPCGFTFEHPSAPKYTGGGLAYHASVTGTWAISWVDYTGATGTLGPLQRTTSFDYQVREIQTVGVADP